MIMRARHFLIGLLFLGFQGQQVFAKCRLDKEVVSLSGPMTHLIEEMNLLDDPKLKAISKFHPLEKPFKKKVLAGGLFLSPHVFRDYKDSLIIFDKSREFEYLLKKTEHKDYIEIDSRDQDPFEVINILVLRIRPVLKGCRDELKSLEKKFQNLRENLLKAKLNLKALFFLGDQKRKLPETIISHDGFVLFLKKFDNFKTYPSDLAYVTWSSKIMKELKDYRKIGLIEAQHEVLTRIEREDGHYDLAFRGIMTPGIRQAYFLKAFLEPFILSSSDEQ
ncbi:MAG: hypothetical protein CME65_09935 [Halobacteriovoraceae bacterium]|nr:hypothetical protein [Halobacteriovoraceae bacterium]